MTHADTKHLLNPEIRHRMISWVAVFMVAVGTTHPLQVMAEPPVLGSVAPLPSDTGVSQAREAQRVAAYRYPAMRALPPQVVRLAPAFSSPTLNDWTPAAATEKAAENSKLNGGGDLYSIALKSTAGGIPFGVAPMYGVDVDFREVRNAGSQR